mgnify:CR=1 FL=1
MLYPSEEIYVKMIDNWLMFLLKCCEEAHRPVECATVARWILKNSAESENMNWYVCFCLFSHIMRYYTV